MDTPWLGKIWPSGQDSESLMNTWPHQQRPRPLEAEFSWVCASKEGAVQKVGRAL